MVNIGGCELGGHTRIIVPLMGSSVDVVLGQIDALAGQPVDMVEWRADAMIAAMTGTPVNEVGATLVEAGRTVAASCPLPVIATIRTANEGGLAQLNDEDYAHLVGLLAAVFPAVDVEIMREDAPGIIAAAHRAGAVVVASNHDFDQTPDDDRLTEVFQLMNRGGADILKIACQAQSPFDVVRVLGAQVWARAAFDRPIIAIAMGEAGAITRLSGSHLASAATFATVGEASAPGQMTAKQTRMMLDLVG